MSNGKRRLGLMSQEELQAERDDLVRAKQTRLDKTRLALAYTRQSTERQTVKNKESAREQAELTEYAKTVYTWPEGKIKLVNENLLDKWGNTLAKPRAASGRLDASLRAGLRESEQSIKEDRVGVVFIHDVSRLFRDPDMINPPQFAKLCKEHGVVVVDYASSCEYDFNATARNDLEDFLEEAQDAANYLKLLRKTLHKRKERKGMRGEYAGGAIPTGFMLDEDRTNYVPNPLWCDTVKWLTRRYRELDADLTALHNEIYDVAIFCELPEHIKKNVGRIQLQPVNGGYTIASHTSLRWLLVNPTNIGHRVFKRRIVKEDAHPAIVDREDYQFALDHLGNFDFEGNAIERPQRTARYTQGQRREGLLAGVRSNGKPVLTSPQGSVYVFQHTGSVHGVYAIKDNHYEGEYTGSIGIDVVDMAVSQRLEDKLYDLLYHAEGSEQLIETVNKSEVISDTPEAQAWGREINEKVIANVREEQASARAILDHMASLKQQVHGSLAKIDETIVDIENKIAFKQREYDVAKSVMSDEDIKEHYASLARLRSRMTDLVEKRKQAAQVDREIETVKSRLERARDEWQAWTLEDRRAFIRLITQDVRLEVLSDRLLKLTIVWSPVFSDHAEYTLLMREKAGGAGWSEQENNILYEMYPQAVRSDILVALPRRSWEACKMRAKSLGIDRINREHGELHIPSKLALDDWLVMHKLGVKLGEEIGWRIESGAAINLDGVL